MTPEVTKIGNKLFDKVEFASQKVELGIIQDIIALSKQGQDLNTNASDGLDRALVLYNESLKPLNASKKLIDKVKSDATALGLEIPNETIAIFNRIDSFINNSNSAIKQIRAIV
jgi:hypothetical protein